MQKLTIFKYIVLLSICLCMVPGTWKDVFGVGIDDEQEATFEKLQQQIISLRKEFKLRMAQAENDQRLIYENIQKKLKALVDSQEALNTSQPETIQKAQELLAVIEEYNEKLTLLEQTLETVETSMTQNLDTIEAQLDVIKEQGLPRSSVRPSVVSPTNQEEPEEPASPAFEFSPGQLFRAAYRIYMDGDYEIAIAGFQKYLEEYPNTQLAGAAQYWIAESLAKLEEYDIAIQEYEHLIKKYPLNDKIADAYYGIGVALLKLGRISEAKANFTYVVDHFSGSIAARKAQNRLDELR